MLGWEAALSWPFTPWHILVSSLATRVLCLFLTACLPGMGTSLQLGKLGMGLHGSQLEAL